MEDPRDLPQPRLELTYVPPFVPGDHSTRAGVGRVDGGSDGDGFAGASGVRAGGADRVASGVRSGTSIRTGDLPCPSVPAGCTVHPAAPTAPAASAARTAIPRPFVLFPRTPAPVRPAPPDRPGRHLSHTPDVTGAEQGGMVGSDRTTSGAAL